MDAITSAVPDATGPPDATPEHEVLAALRPLGVELAKYRFPARNAECMKQRARVRAQIRPILERGIEAGFTKVEMAEVLRIGTSGLTNILNDNPTGRWAGFATGASVSPELREQLTRLRHDLETYRFAHSVEDRARRAQAQAEVREVVEAHPEATRNDMAKVLAISFQQLCNILNDDPTGRSRG
jgi:hypothetical protein